MGALWVVAEPGPDGGLARISAEAATLARGLGDRTRRDVVGLVIAADPTAAAAELATLRADGPDDHGPGRRGQRLVRRRGGTRGRAGRERCARCDLRRGGSRRP